jgi:endonuclease YncB( thermonuclease family)
MAGLTASYVRKCTYVRTIDGDTFEGILDHGTYNRVALLTKVIVRLHGVDAWEMHKKVDGKEVVDERGDAAREFTRAALESSHRIVVQTYKEAAEPTPIGTTWARVVADVEVDGQNLSDLVRENGHEKVK